MPSYDASMSPITFVGGDEGSLEVTEIRALRGAPLDTVDRVDVRPRLEALDGAWSLRGVASHARYTQRRERDELDLVSPALGRTEAYVAVLIPIRKNTAWWALAQDERREIFEGRSRHIERSLPLLPRIARRLFHARDLGEPFDFLTYFELAPEHEHAFDELVASLRETEEWSYVAREVEVRMRRAPRPSRRDEAQR